MKRSTKKGFTIVELVIVIAIIAILAAVLIPTFASLIQKANESKDTQLVKNLNTALAADNKEHKTMHDALDAAVEFGYDVGKINASATNKEILWDSKNDVFCYYDTNTKTPEYIPETSLKNGAIKSDETYKLWKIYTTAPDTQTFSIYWNSTENFTAPLTVGFDAGTNTAITALKYERTGETVTPQEVVIRTNGSTLEVNALTDTVSRYGVAASVKVTAVADNSYHEFGEVVGNIEVVKGRVEIAESAKVAAVVVTGDGVKVDVKNPEVKVNVKEGVTAEVTGVEQTSVKIVSTYDELTAALKNGGSIFLGADIKSSKQLKVDGGVSLTIDLNGYTISGRATSSPLIGVKGKLTINGQGKITSDSTSSSLIYVYDYEGSRGELTVNGGTFELVKSTPGTPLIINGPTGAGDFKGGVVTINGGEFIAKEFCIGTIRECEVTINGGTFTSMDNAVIGTLGTEGKGKNKITINGGVFNGYIKSPDAIACGVYLANDDTLTVNGGTFNIYNGIGILVRSGKATIGKDVTINLYNSESQGTVGDSSVILNSSVGVVLDLKSTYPGGKPQIVSNESVYKTYTIE